MVAWVAVANLVNKRSKVEDAVMRSPTAVEVGRIANWESNDQLDPDPAGAI